MNAKTLIITMLASLSLQFGLGQEVHTEVIAGNVMLGYQDGRGDAARFSSDIPIIRSGWSGSIVVADRGNGRLRLLAPDGEVTTIASESGELFHQLVDMQVDIENQRIWTLLSESSRKHPTNSVTFTVRIASLTGQIVDFPSVTNDAPSIWVKGLVKLDATRLGVGVWKGPGIGKGRFELLILDLLSGNQIGTLSVDPLSFDNGIHDILNDSPGTFAILTSQISSTSALTLSQFPSPPGIPKPNVDHVSSLSLGAAGDSFEALGAGSTPPALARDSNGNLYVMAGYLGIPPFGTEDITEIRSFDTSLRGIPAARAKTVVRSTNSFTGLAIDTKGRLITAQPGKILALDLQYGRVPLNISRLPDGRIEVTGTQNVPVTLEASTNLITWSPKTASEIVDSRPTGGSIRYRIETANRQLFLRARTQQ